MIGRLIVVAVVLGLTLHAGRSAEVRKEFSGGVSIKGDIVFGDDLKFRSIVRGMPKAVVFLESPGGNPIVAMAIGRIIRARSFNTQITAGTCASACGLIWLAGKHRGIGPTGRVGFHAAYNNVTLQEVGAANALIGAYLNELGLSDKAIYYITQAPPTDMQWLNARDANKVGIVASLDNGPANLTTLEPGTYRRKWIDSCINATREEWTEKQLADGVIYGFCGCVAKKIMQTVTPEDLAGPSPRPKIVEAYDFCRRRACQAVPPCEGSEAMCQEFKEGLGWTAFFPLFSTR